jgi:hypothetical protein
LLIACVVQAVGSGSGNPDWLSATDERRKEIFTACLSRRLRVLGKKRSGIKVEGASQALYDQLLRRQIAVLETYCSAVGVASATHTERATDFSSSFR